MRVHFDVLGWLYIVCGIFGILTGFSLGVLASGTSAALDELSVAVGPSNPTVWLLVICGLLFLAGGLVMLIAGRALVRRTRLARPTALVVAVPTLLAVPFGTALGIYTFWALLNDDARREFQPAPIQSGDESGC
jgi:hypothetical protein